MNKSNNSRRFPRIPAILSLFFVALIFVASLSFSSLSDLYLSMVYSPSEKVENIESSLSLTKTGRRIFRASAPSLESDHTVFESLCYGENSSSDSTILGCFRDRKIFVYDIDSSELSGIVESTSAHELLHAIYSRLPSGEKSTLAPILEEIYASSSDDFRESVSSYPDSERLEEIYVRSATQLPSLPASLESHFAKYFSDRPSLVAYYDSYITPFTAIKNTLASLETELKEKKQKIEEKTSEYTSRSATFSEEVSAFNSCAATPGCYSSATFASERSRLLAEQSSLSSLFDEINSDISTYNERIELYNGNILHEKSLENLINPNKGKEQL